MLVAFGVSVNPFNSIADGFIHTEKQRPNKCQGVCVPKSLLNFSKMTIKLLLNNSARWGNFGGIHWLVSLRTERFSTLRLAFASTNQTS